MKKFIKHCQAHYNFIPLNKLPNELNEYSTTPNTFEFYQLKYSLNFTV